MYQTNTKEMRWIDGTLHYRHDAIKGWQSYTTHPLKKPDYPIEKGSKGYSTMQFLLKQGYVFA